MFVVALFAAFTLVLAAHDRSEASIALKWVDVLDLGVGGRPFPSNSGNLTFARLPPSAQADVSHWEWEWSLTSAGLFAQFSSNATSIHLRYTLRDSNVTTFSNFPPIGYSGCDLYAWDETLATWRWVASTFNGLSAAMSARSANVLESPLYAISAGWPIGPIPAQPSSSISVRYRLHFPSYNGVLSMEVGIPDSGASLVADRSWNTTKPPVTYIGTSIAQGGITPRPGDAFVSRLSRNLSTSVLNLGFCGACLLELGLAKWMAAIETNTSLVVIDCGWNMSPNLVAENAVPFIKALRSRGVHVPIVIVEPTDFTPSWILGDFGYNITGVRAEFRRAYQALVAAGDLNLHYVTASQLRPGISPIEDVTFEGIHPLDYGHTIMANALTNVLEPLLQNPNAKSNPVTMPSATYLSSIAEPNINGWAAPIWTDAVDLTIRGRAFSDTPTPWNRLPNDAKGVVRGAVWDLSQNSAGITVSFATDSPGIWVKYTAASNFESMVHFPPTGVSGVDLYAWDSNTSSYRFVSVAALNFNTNSYEAQITPSYVNITTPGSPVRWLLYCATYNTITSLSIGITPESKISPDEPYVSKPTDPSKPPIVWYGTSILQGGVEFRPGNIITARVGRALNREVFNFGFSGNGEMETTVGQFLARISDKSVLIIDCSWNMNAQSITANAIPFVNYMRSHGYQTTPIVLSEGLPFGRNWAVPEAAQEQDASNAALLDAYNQLVKGGDKHLYYMKTADLFSYQSLIDSSTANGLHPTDGGMHDMAQAWIQLLPQIIQ